MNCWNILGIAATNDTAIIKKAYAARLKVTRPDDDAVAYQQLRDAYQLALKQTTSAAPQEVAVPAPVETSAEIRPEQFIGIVFQRWHVEDQSSLMAFWPELNAMLDRVPLDQAKAFSNIAAALVLEYPKLPVEFVEQLSVYFEWKRDFTLPRSLGTSRAADLLARLDRLPFELEALRLKKEYEQEAVTKAANQAKEAEQQRVQNIKQEFARTSDFARLLKTADTGTCKRHAFLVGPGLRQEWSKLSDEHLDVLHIDAETRDQGKVILSQAARARTTVTAAIAAASAIASVISGTFESYALPFLLLLLTSYLLPLGQWHEKARTYLYPAGMMRRLLTDGVRDSRFPRTISVMMCFYAVIICAAVHNLEVGDIYAPAILAVIAFLLFISWATPPEDSHPDLEITPAIFGLCAISSWTLGAKSAMIVSVAALWHALSYASYKRTWLYSCIVLWIPSSILLYFYYGRVPLAVLGVGVPWLLFTLYRKESLEYALVALAISIIYLPFANAATQMIWTGVVTLAWIAGSAGMRWWSKRTVYQQSSSGLSRGNQLR